MFQDGENLSNVIRQGVPQQGLKIRYISSMHFNWELLSNVRRLDLPRQCVRIGYGPAM